MAMQGRGGVDGRGRGARWCAWAWACTWLLLGTLGCSDDADGGSQGGDGDGDRDAAVGGDGDGDGDGDAEPGTWTVFVYGHGDHNLSNSLVRDIVEMAEAEIDEAIQVIVFADFDASQALGDGSTFPSGAQWLLVTGSGAEPELVGEEDELDLDDPAILAAAVQTAFSSFPAERRAVILWDHGGSWQGGFGGDSQDGTRRAVTPLSAEDVAAAVAAGLEGAGIPTDESSPPLELFAFDTCLMAGAEVVAEFAALSRVYIGSAEIDYGDGLDYTGLLEHLSAHPNDTALELGRAEVALWDAHHEAAGANDVVLRSHVALDLSRLDAFHTAFASLTDAWLNSPAAMGDQLGRAAYFARPPYMNQLSDPGEVPELRDVGQFLARLDAVTDAEVARSAEAARTALDALIVARSQGELREAGAQSGLHMQLPLAATISDEMLTSYAARAKRWRAASNWDQALLALTALDDGAGPDVSVQLFNGTGADANNLPTVQFGSTAADLAEVEVTLAARDAGNANSLLMLGIVGKGATDPDVLYEFAWDGQVLTLPDGQGGNQAISLRVWEDVAEESSTPPVLAIFGTFTEVSGASAFAALLFQDGDAEAGLLAVLDPPVTLLLSDVARDLPGSSFTPLIPAIDVATHSESVLDAAPIALNAATLPLEWLPAAAAEYALVTTLHDVYGNASADIQLVTLAAPIVP